MNIDEEVNNLDRYLTISEIAGWSAAIVKSIIDDSFDVEEVAGDYYKLDDKVRAIAYFTLLGVIGEIVNPPEPDNALVTV